jgi:multifunctional methyltransferase subunit TRM112
MRLITHNMVQCHVKDCNTNNFPLRFEDAEVELIEAEYNPTFLINMLPKLDWEALINTAVQVSSLSSCVFCH